MLYPISERTNKINITDFGFIDESYLSSLPGILAGADFRAIVEAIQRARYDDQDIVIMLGAHVIKCGCSAFINELIAREYITHIAMNGGAAIHDYEIACFGSTSESVEENLPEGKFGMWQETYKMLDIPKETSLPVGFHLGERVAGRNFSIMASAYECSVPCTIHTAVGADFIHDPDMDLSSFVLALLNDLLMFDHKVKTLSENAVILNFGCAVILPEVWLKCLSRAINSGKDFSGITCANFDMNQPYRAIEQIVKRPRLLGATTYNFVGQHELLIPLLVRSVLNV